ncbi:MAG TPA: hypothetical protein VEV37_04365 [Bryobacteraceae bacterium]|nr:hypothetical protein [Bryobacteraceae bacterium]
MQSRNNRRRKNQKGTSVLEFSLIIRPTVLMLMGVVVVGNELGRAVEAAQVCRDADSMYVRGVDFAQSGNQAELARIGQALNLQSSNSGNGIVILLKSCRKYFHSRPVQQLWSAGRRRLFDVHHRQYRLAQRTIIGNTSLPGTHFPTTGTRPTPAKTT